MPEESTSVIALATAHERPTVERLREIPRTAELVLLVAAGATADVAALDASRGDADAVAVVEPLSDALKEVDADTGRIVTALDRSAYGYPALPQLVRASALRDAVEGLPAGEQVDPATAVLRHGGVVRACGNHPR